MRINEPTGKVAGFSAMKRRVLFIILSLTLTSLLAVPAAIAQETPFDSQYAPPIGPPPTTECVPPGDSGGSGSAGDAEDCEDLEVLPVTGGLETVPFSVLAPAALLGAGIVVTTGIVAIRRRR